MPCYDVRDSLHGYRIRAESRKIGEPNVIAKTGRYKPQHVILMENAEAIIERKLGWMTEDDRKRQGIYRARKVFIIIFSASIVVSW